MNHRRSTFASAFTLIELIFVLAIIALIATLVVPDLANFERGQRAGDTADQIIALSRWARAEAIERGISFRLNIDPSQGRYWLTKQTGASYENVLQDSQSGSLGLSSGTATQTQFVDGREEMARVFSAPSGVTLACNFPQQPDGQYVEFRSTGRCDPGSVRVIDSRGQVIEVGNLSATETYHLLTADEKQQEQSLSQPPPTAAAR